MESSNLFSGIFRTKKCELLFKIREKLFPFLEKYKKPVQKRV